MTSDWVAAGKLKSSVISKTKQSKPTVERRIASLVEQGALERRGAGSASSYRSTGLI
jgi:DNA-binding IclR family transcriptional regulator